ncbi:hypothetical protein [Halomonas sp. BM-2019]|uniref:hypothetical protein n=1 Tax=Halomonas sp. BM-2019 TaxID=2811227 RepID=UPI001B3C23D4|nr:MAG: hypothetical protein J5F18_10215 [Halomonas sp. BM-2019]
MSQYVFSTPAGQGPKDFAAIGREGDLPAFLAAWDAHVTGWSRMGRIGNPWSSQYDAPRDWYFDPTETGWPQGQALGIDWTPFPNRLTTFFENDQVVKGGQLNQALSDDQLLELADHGRITLDGKTWRLWDPEPKASDLLKIPATKCPEIDWQGAWSPFSPPGPRGWLDEYCEWAITYDDDQTLRSVLFTCENPAYWLSLWRLDPTIVLALYRRYIDPAVALEDLYLRYTADTPTGKQGDPVVDPTTGHPAYDPTNKWNRGTLRIPGQQGGAMHLTSPPNTLSAEIYLAAASTILRQSATPTDPQALICCSRYGQNFRNSDPHIGAQGNAVVGGQKQRISLADPVGLYIQTPNWELFETPDGTPASAFWTVTRGSTGQGNSAQDKDSILQAVFEVPKEKGYGINDIKINGQPIRYAGQIARTFKIALRVCTLAPDATTPPNRPQPCVVPQAEARLQPWPVQLVPETLFYGLSSSDLPALLQAGTSHRFMLVVQGASQDTRADNARIQFDRAGVEARVVEYLPDASAIPGQTDGGGTQGYLLEIRVDAGATPGPIGIRALNPWEDASVSAADHPYEVGLGLVVAASGR